MRPADEGRKIKQVKWREGASGKREEGSKGGGGWTSCEEKKKGRGVGKSGVKKKKA